MLPCLFAPACPVNTIGHDSNHPYAPGMTPGCCTTRVSQAITHSLLPLRVGSALSSPYSSVSRHLLYSIADDRHISVTANVTGNATETIDFPPSFRYTGG